MGFDSLCRYFPIYLGYSALTTKNRVRVPVLELSNLVQQLTRRSHKPKITGATPVIASSLIQVKMPTLHFVYLYLVISFKRLVFSNNIFFFLHSIFLESTSNTISFSLPFQANPVIASSLIQVYCLLLHFVYIFSFFFFSIASYIFFILNLLLLYIFSNILINKNKKIEWLQFYI